ncbi:hypothetical protein C1637_19520 [Chryseobacterium lactis]|uniref:Outer membrane protein beta-barrel domain-containing protein n=1 Tax=Chryseobacterium lactis TaxID=1241981 RepID=A0A3G6RN79_CHRLC|nr:hypothetical protein [Chryseobacterium lactis]AZA83160.1 hypothetical protein EG342_15305 [Chryseobacterium lactis]AZB03544.1 hypothetical protein EG341_06175 [Chryseobacterium lactis]PNW11950.1 hypothetical protein C1637_19520 [Chryseobacterium lactis]
MQVYSPIKNPFSSRISFLFFLILGFSSSSLKSQELLNNENKKFIFDFGGTFGAFFPYNGEDGFKNTIGSNAMTTLQATYKNSYFVRFKFGQTTVNYKTHVSFNSLQSKVDVKSNSTSIGLDIGYQRLYGRWQPFVFAGSGLAIIEEPKISYHSFNNQIDYGTKSSTNLYINAGFGVNYIISKSFIILGECQFYSVPGISKNSLTHLNGVSPVIGIKALL